MMHEAIEAPAAPATAPATATRPNLPNEEELRRELADSIDRRNRGGR